MVQYKYSKQKRTSYNLWGWCWWITWLLLIGILITFFVLALTTPRQIEGYYNKVRLTQSDCTKSELYDTSLQLCAPITYLPTAVSGEMMNIKMNRCHSFYKHMNGNWIKNHTNADRAFTFLYKKNLKEVHDIIKDPSSGPIYNFYRSCLDTLVLKQHKYESQRQRNHVKEYILGALKTHADLPVVLGRLAKYGFNGVFSLVIESHPTLSKMIPLIRYDTVPGFSNDLSKQLTMWHAQTENENFIDYVIDGTFNRDITQMSELIEWAPLNFFSQYLREISNLDEIKDVWLLDKSYFHNLLTRINTFPIEQWKQFVEASINHNMDDFLPAVPSDSYFRSHLPIGENIAIAHKLQKHPDAPNYTEEHCMAATHKLLPGIIANEFLHRDMRHSEEIRVKVTKLVEDVRNAYSQIIHETTWMDATTKEKAEEKIRSIIVRAVHPNTWEQEPFALRITSDRYLRNLNMIRRYRVQRNHELWRDKFDRDASQRFGAPLTTVNAYYSPQSNSITVFAGIVRKPFYSRSFDQASLYATLGMVIGHELSHALDNYGRLFDKNGNLVKWWEDSDVISFTKLADCVISEYGPPNGCDNAKYGTQTLGEDIADITGISIAYRAFTNSNPNATDDEKRNFFMAFAQMWATSYDKTHKCRQVNSDVHAIAMFRVDKTLKQLPEFARLFNCKPGDKMVNANPCKIYG
jgi:predicted metalloendopeptidase